VAAPQTRYSTGVLALMHWRSICGSRNTSPSANKALRGGMTDVATEARRRLDEGR
jgi:hypothetical protein